MKKIIGFFKDRERQKSLRQAKVIAGHLQYAIPDYFYHEMFAKIGIETMRKLVERADQNKSTKGHYDYEDIDDYYTELTQKMREAECYLHRH